MSIDISFIPLILLILLIGYNITTSLLSKERFMKYSPVVFYGLYLCYYIIIPFFDSKRMFHGISSSSGVFYLVIGAFLSYLFFLIGFSHSSNTKPVIFTHYNDCLTVSNSKKLGFIVLFIGILAWSIGNGFNFNVTYTESDQERFNAYNATRGNTGYTEVYLTALKTLMTVGACILYASSIRTHKRWYVPAILISVLVAIQGGFRGEMAKAIIIFAIFYQNFPSTKKINLKIWGPIFIVFWISLGVLERSRSYGHGINIERVLQMREEGSLTEKSGENISVFNASAIVMEYYAETGERVYFAPIINAALMPLPRAIFPWKPAGEYGGNVFNALWHGNIGGIAYMSIVEAFMSFGWIGIIIYAFLIGKLARLFWNNFIFNRTSIGAIILLASFNAILYVFTSRGYLAAQFMNYMYNVIIPFWIIRLLQKIYPKLNPKIEN